MLLLAVPVIAGPDAASTDMNAATGGSGIADSDPQSPVLDGSAFTNYDTIFFHGSLANANPASVGVLSEGNYFSGHRIFINRSSSYVYVNCPLIGYDSKQGGIQPKVKYLGFEYNTSGAAEIYAVDVFNGPNLIDTFYFNPPLKSTAFTVKVIDLGAWYRFNRGLDMGLYLRNPSATSYGEIRIAGYGARFEW